jgi:hypothetical protein
VRVPIPPALDAAILACLAKEPSERPASAAVLDRRLAAAMPADESWTPEEARAWWDLRRVVVNPAERAATGTPPEGEAAPAQGRCWPKFSTPMADPRVRRPSRWLVKPSSAPPTLATHPEPQGHSSLFFFQLPGQRQKNLLERALSVFADVRAGEGVSTLLMALNVFLLLAGYSLMKPARDGLILTEGGAEVASYSAAAQAVLLMGAVPLYGWLGTTVVRIVLISIVMTFFSVTLIGFYLGGVAGLREGVAFYIWIGSSTSSSCRSSGSSPTICSPKGQGRRLFPLVGVGQSLGAWVGAAAVAPLVQGLELHALHAHVHGRVRADGGARDHLDRQRARGAPRAAGSAVDATRPWVRRAASS